MVIDFARLVGALPLVCSQRIDDGVGTIIGDVPNMTVRMTGPKIMRSGEGIGGTGVWIARAEAIVAVRKELAGIFSQSVCKSCLTGQRNIRHNYLVYQAIKFYKQ
jgi:hypothetical protein